MATSAQVPERPLELDPSRFVGSEAPHVAVVDIGSNSVRMVVYDQLSRAPFPRFNEKALCRLGEGRNPDGGLAEAAVQHTLRTVRRFFAISRAMQVDRIDVLATEAVRKAPNGGDLVEGIRGLCHAEVRLLEGREEARFSALGVISGFHRPRGLMGDIGGGSVEIAEVLDDRVGDRWVSLPLGALPVTQLLADGFGAAKKRVDAMLKEALPPLLTEPVFYTVGGGWRALAGIQLARTEPLCRVAHGFEMDAKAVRALAKEIARSSPDQVAVLPGAPSRRAATLPASALVLDRVLKALKPERVVFSALGLREGWLYSLLTEAERYLDPLVEGAQAFGTARARVPAFGAALVRFTDPLFPAETAGDRRLRLAACALSDIAWQDHADIRAAECFRRVLQLPFIGISHPERAFLAATLHARHSGKADDPMLAGVRDMLSAAALRRAQILGKALQLGYRFSGSVPSILDEATLEVEANLARLRIRRPGEEPDSDAVRTRLSQLGKVLDVADTELAIDG